MEDQQRGLLDFSPPPPETVVFKDRVCICTEGSHPAVFLQGLVLMHYDVADHAAEECAMVTLFEAGYADQNEIARTFRYTPRNLRRY